MERWQDKAKAIDTTTRRRGLLCKRTVLRCTIVQSRLTKTGLASCFLSRRLTRAYDRCLFFQYIRCIFCAEPLAGRRLTHSAAYEQIGGRTCTIISMNKPARTLGLELWKEYSAEELRRKSINVIRVRCTVESRYILC